LITWVAVWVLLFLRPREISVTKERWVCFGGFFGEVEREIKGKG
jgi:hypothetical protein